MSRYRRVRKNIKGGSTGPEVLVLRYTSHGRGALRDTVGTEEGALVRPEGPVRETSKPEWSTGTTVGKPRSGRGEGVVVWSLGPGRPRGETAEGQPIPTSEEETRLPVGRRGGQGRGGGTQVRVSRRPERGQEGAVRGTGGPGGPRCPGRRKGPVVQTGDSRGAGDVRQCTE